jgi:hypothetical protein
MKSSIVILGDINTRFRDPIFQSGEPGPLERLQVFTDFLTEMDYQYLKPIQGTEKLTIDYCFVRSGQVIILKLVNNVD